MIKNNTKKIQIIETWDIVLFKIYNFIQYIYYALFYFNIKKVIYKNLQLKGLHEGERCFILFGGTSLKDVDLSAIKNKTTFCVNHFYKTEEFDVVNPNYYCATDSHIFSKENKENYIKDIVEKTKGSAKCIFSQKAIPLNIQDDHVYISYSKHKPTKNYIRSDLASISSNFGSISMFTINCAIYMGFKEIYLLGYDFPPGNMPHFYKESPIESSWRNKRLRQNEKYEVCERHWQYAQAQFENYYLAEYAVKKGVKIYNCNPGSNVRAFEFKTINEVLNEM